MASALQQHTADIADNFLTASNDNYVARLLKSSSSLGHAPADIDAFRKQLRRPNGLPDFNVMERFGNVYNGLRTIDSYEPVLNARAWEVDTHYSAELLAENIQKLKDAGVSLEEVVSFFNKGVKISASYTPHPTETLSTEGIVAARALVAAAEKPQENRTAELVAAIEYIIQNPGFGAQKKANILDEIDASNTTALIHNTGVNALDRRIEDAIEQVYGERVKIHTNTSPRSWDYDADGKNNAEGFAMVAKMATTTMGSFQYLKSQLEQAAELADEDEKRKIQDVLKETDFMIEALAPIYKESRDIVQKLADTPPEKREAVYREEYEKYDQMVSDFSKIYDVVGSKNRGFDHFTKTVDALDELRLSVKDAKASGLIDDAFRTVQRCGFALEKGQTRHNDEVHGRIIDNLFAYDDFLNRKDDAGNPLFSNQERRGIKVAGKFSKLSPERQAQLWKKVLKFAKDNGNRADLIEDLKAANPLQFESNGYPSQERTYIDRLVARSKFGYKFEEGVISDADIIASPRQWFLAELTGNMFMKHMSLNEDDKTLDKQSELVEVFRDTVGDENIANRNANLKDKGMGTDYQGVHVMRPASDAEKKGGSATRLQAFRQYRAMVRSAIRMETPVQIMIGGGLSMGRFGGDVSRVRRVVAQELKDYAMERRAEGNPIDPRDPTDRKILDMANYVMYTQQGRARRIYSATSDQVADDFAAKMSEMIEDKLDLEEYVKDHTYIDPSPKLSPEMEKFTHIVETAMIRRYAGFRNIAVQNDDGTYDTSSLIINDFMDDIRCPNMMAYVNNGARPASKTGKKLLTEVRAIENDESMMAGQIFHGGFMQGGAAMEMLHEAVNDPAQNISLQDVDSLVNNDEWDYAIFSRNLTDAGRFNATHVLSRISDRPEEWTFDKLVEIGNEALLVKIEGTPDDAPKYELRYEGRHDLTQKELYFCKIYYDRLRFLTLTEASLTKEGEGVTMSDKLETIVNAFRPSDNGIEVDLGQRTKEKWPVTQDIIEEHRKNMPGYALLYEMEDHIAMRKEQGWSKERIEIEVGDGDRERGESILRQIGSAWRSGTLPHKPIWTGEYNYGVKNRKEARLADANLSAVPNTPREGQVHFNM